MSAFRIIIHKRYRWDAVVNTLDCAPWCRGRVKRGKTLHYVYMLRCADGTLYTGWTTDLTARLRAHNGEGKGGAKYTRSRRPVTLVYHEVFEDGSTAKRREYAIKQLTRAEKEALAALGAKDNAAKNDS